MRSLAPLAGQDAESSSSCLVCLSLQTLRYAVALEAAQDMETTKVDLMVQLLNDTEGDPGTQWLLWADLRTMISNPAFAFPIVKSYEEAGAELVVFGNKAGLMDGDSWSAHRRCQINQCKVSV